MAIQGQTARGVLHVSGSSTDFVSYQPVIVNGAGQVQHTQVASRSMKAEAAPVATTPPPGLPLRPTETGQNSAPAAPLKAEVLVKDMLQLKAEPGSAALAGPQKSNAGFRVTEVRLEGRSLAPCLFWSKDARSFFYVQHENGIVGEVALDGFREKQRIDLQRKVSWLCPSQHGLLATLADTQEVWLLDARTLKVLKRYMVGGLSRAVSSPALKRAVVCFRGGGNEELGLLDLDTGTLTTKVVSNELQQGVPPTPHGPQVTADGKLLFAFDHSRLFRYRVEADSIVYDQATPDVLSGRQENLCLSPDSKWVCMPSGGGNGSSNMPNHPQVPSYSTFVYSTADITPPVYSLHQGAYPTAVGFDTKAGWVYAQNIESAVLIFNPSGVKLKQSKFRSENFVRQILPHPDGRKLLELHDKVQWIEME